jgi:hypothetical protein
MIRPRRCYGVPDLLQVPIPSSCGWALNAKGSARHCFCLNDTVCAELLFLWSWVRSLHRLEAGVSSGMKQPLAKSRKCHNTVSHTLREPLQSHTLQHITLLHENEACTVRPPLILVFRNANLMSLHLGRSYE